MQRTNYLILLFFVLTFEPSFGMADIYKVFAGEGNLPNAEIALDKANNFRLQMVCHSRNYVSKTMELGVQIFVADNSRVSKEVAKLRKVSEGTSVKLDVCFNEKCSTYSWDYCDGCGSDREGGPLMTDLSVDTSVSFIRSVRLIVPNDIGRYEFRGDVSSILNRICRATR
jgi:hypothetical protein